MGALMWLELYESCVFCGLRFCGLCLYGLLFLVACAFVAFAFAACSQSHESYVCDDPFRFLFVLTQLGLRLC